MTEASRELADALLYNPLSYRDETGDNAVRYLRAGRITIRWEDGSTISFEEPDARRIIWFLKKVYSFRLSRKGHLWGTENKNPGAAPTATGVGNASPTRS